jgi:hypothetical protein
MHGIGCVLAVFTMGLAGVIERRTRLKKSSTNAATKIEHEQTEKGSNFRNSKGFYTFKH